MSLLNTSNFRRWCILTIISVYLLIFIGGIVRSTGSGMGCPDWPKCFGTWIPPSSKEELPKDYKEIYSNKRKLKNQKVSNYLKKLGFADLSLKILNDPSVYNEEIFNPTKTIIEYLNRVIGVLIGFFIFITFIFSFSFWKSDKIIPLLCFASLIFVGFQGWLGSIVVSTNLLPGLITIHMLVALLIVFLLIFSILRSYKNEFIPVITNENKIKFFIILGLLFTLIQIVLGTKVREMTDLISIQLGESRRNEWIGNFGNIFLTHRSFSWLVLINNIILLYFIKRSYTKIFFYNFSKLLIFLIVTEIASGISMNYFSIPPYVQPIHLLFATLIFGVQSVLLLSLMINKKEDKLKKI